MLGATLYGAGTSIVESCISLSRLPWLVLSDVGRPVVENSLVERRSIMVSGVVQGVGFRPFVFDLASRFGLSGFVKNENGRVLIEVEGNRRLLDSFLVELNSNAPPLARIESVRWESRPPIGSSQFCIEESETITASPIFVSPDIATCDACLAELFDPTDRRYRYPFLNCTNCGPRLTIIKQVPYDRERTTMAAFPMCAACREEYEDPSDRRFHAQPTACPECGPRLEVLDGRGQPIHTGDPLAYAVAALRAGGIAAVKGLGGYHLACDARNQQAVTELRRRKHRDEKPLAIMVADVRVAQELCEVSLEEQHRLLSRQRPIVLMRRLPGIAVAENVAPRNGCLGVMLPYTPLHHLLLRELSEMPLVMTSGNQSDEPIAYSDGDAVSQLGGIVDFFLTHNRTIHLRCDDSVTRIVAGAELPIRRSRGYAPQPLTLPLQCSHPTLAAGGQFKVTFALGREQYAFLSHHIGDLDHYEAYRAYVEAIEHHEHLFDIAPERIVHDLHPDYASTQYALRRVADSGLEHFAVQHHHAHMASCMAEHGLNEPVIGVTFDGTGYGRDGAIWGGEFLVGDYRDFRRAAHLRYVAMPGGDQAIHEPWRMSVAYLADARLDRTILKELATASAIRIVERMIARRFNAPLTSSMGRLFDGVAALAGVRSRVSYEGQAAIELEWLASRVAPDGVYPFELTRGSQNGSADDRILIDIRPLIEAVVNDVSRGRSAEVVGRRFHSTVVEIIVQVCNRLRTATGLDAVVLTGGVFMNALLLSEAVECLTVEGFRVFRHQRVPPNDGGLCLGQLAVAAAMTS